MTVGKFEEAYNKLMDEVESKLKTDSRLLELRERFNFERGAPTEEPRGYPMCYISEGRIRNIQWDSMSALLTVEFALEYYIMSRNKEQGVRDIRQRTLKLFDTLVGTIADRRLEVDGVSLANGDNGVRVIDADFGYFSPDSKSIVYKGIMQVEIDIDVPLV